jgi:hypothetical protein
MRDRAGADKKKPLRGRPDDGTVVVSGRVPHTVPSRITVERAMTDREHEQLLATATDRFERRLAGEIGALQVTMVEQDSATRRDITNQIADLRVEMSEQGAALRRENSETRLELSAEIAKLRLDMVGQFGESRVHTEARHRQLLKWALVFWVGQAAAVAGIVSAFT